MTIQFLIILFLISGVLFCTLYFGRVYFRKFIDKITPFPFLREGSSYNDRHIKNITYEGFVVQTFIMMAIMSIVVLFASEINVYFNIGFFLVAILPPSFLLLRIKTFSDSSILPETNRGYDPVDSYVLSFLGMAMGLVIGFSSLNFDYTPLIFPIVMISGALITSLIPIFPDYINKILPYEIRSEKGTWTLRIINAVAISIQGVIFLYFSLFIF